MQKTLILVEFRASGVHQVSINICKQTSILIDFSWISSLGSPSNKHNDAQKTSILSYFSWIPSLGSPSSKHKHVQTTSILIDFIWFPSLGSPSSKHKHMQKTMFLIDFSWISSLGSPSSKHKMLERMLAGLKKVEDVSPYIRKPALYTQAVPLPWLRTAEAQEVQRLWGTGFAHPWGVWSLATFRAPTTKKRERSSPRQTTAKYQAQLLTSLGKAFAWRGPREASLLVLSFCWHLQRKLL